MKKSNSFDISFHYDKISDDFIRTFYFLYKKMNNTISLKFVSFFGQFGKNYPFYVFRGLPSSLLVLLK